MRHSRDAYGIERLERHIGTDELATFTREHARAVGDLYAASLNARNAKRYLKAMRCETQAAPHDELTYAAYLDAADYYGQALIDTHYSADLTARLLLSIGPRRVS